MKRFFIFLFALSPLYVCAQIESGFYRVQNDYTDRYFSIVDTRASISASASGAGNVDADLDAIYMLKGFEEKVAYNPATICYVQKISSTQCNLTCQGLDLAKQTDNYLSYIQRPNGSYWLYGSYKGTSRYLGDESYEEYGEEFMVYAPRITNITEDRDWWVLPVDHQNDSQYFGVKPDVKATANDYYWSTMYAGFPFIPSESSTKVYVVSAIDENLGYAIISEITTEIPAATPVLFRCASEAPSANRLTLSAPSTTVYGGKNYMVGNYYCNDVASSTGHRNVNAYNSSTMRMLGLTADGKPAFVKSNIKYLPANKCYLSVSSSAPDELKIVTEQEYITGISEMTTNTTDGKKIIYDLQGRRITAPSKGLYIVNGKKVVIK